MEITKPSQIETGKDFFNSVWQHSETETVAMNIVIISKWHNDEWEAFTWEQYKARCAHKVTDSEHTELMTMVKSGHLDHNKETDTFTPNIRFVGEVCKWKKE